MSVIYHIERLKKKNHTNISTAAEKASSKFTSISDKNHKKLGIEGNFLGLTKNISKNTTANIPDF